MKLVLATPLYPPDIGGPATDAASLAESLSQQGTEVAVCTFGSVREFPRFLRHALYTWRLFTLAKGTTALVAFDTVSVGVPAAIVARLRHIPLVVRVPGDYAWEQGVQRFGVRDSIGDFQKNRYGFQIETLRRAQQFTAQSAALVLAPSEYFKTVIAGWGVQSNRLRRVYLGLNFSEKVEMPEKVPEGKILFSLGRFVPWKGFSMLIALLPQLPGWHLVIAGDGPLRSDLEKQARESGVGDRVLFTGPLSHEKVLGWYRRADAFALNTSFESFSFQTLEAMSQGAPVIATAVGSIPELLENGVEGVLCTPNDKNMFREAIVSIETESALWKRRTEAAKQKAMHFTTAVSTQAFAEALKTVCE